jgi:hypothetical protein
VVADEGVLNNVNKTQKSPCLKRKEEKKTFLVGAAYVELRVLDPDPHGSALI